MSIFTEKKWQLKKRVDEQDKVFEELGIPVGSDKWHEALEKFSELKAGGMDREKAFRQAVLEAQE
ncbi:MAG: hypothetical protein HN981_05295 [Candidatus Pacebacteria bacterium]|jgi:hypothetical protein|nr:hypothetical protein [Candidatus Paceibacterota bacterium]MBT6921779.1 hypothetical protein [Candidatus Paceibacterota bacterium]